MANGCATRVQRICKRLQTVLEEGVFCWAVKGYLKRLAGSCKGGGLAVEDIWSCQLQERGGGAFQRGEGELLFGYFGVEGRRKSWVLAMRDIFREKREEEKGRGKEKAGEENPLTTVRFFWGREEELGAASFQEDEREVLFLRGRVRDFFEGELPGEVSLGSFGD